MFLKNSIDLHVVYPGTVKKIIFPYDTLGEITDIRTSCDCSSVENDTVNKQIVVNYKVKDIPKHLEVEGRYKVERTIAIHHKQTDGTIAIDTLKFKAIVKRKS